MAEPETAELAPDVAVARRVGVPIAVDRPAPPGADEPGSETVEQRAETGGVELQALSAFYGTFRALREVSLRVRPRAVTAFIGPSGCGKSTLLRTINRMHETTLHARIEGSIRLDGVDIYQSGISAVRVRRLVGMVFQRPNPFPSMSIHENVAAGLRLSGVRSRSLIDGVVEHSLKRAALWDEVKDKLRQPGTSLSGGQQQRLCIARTIAVEPEVVLMDEPCSALDPISTARIEELLDDLRSTYTIAIVTHNMQQAARVSDYTAFFTMDEERAGFLVEDGVTRTMFTNPSQPLTEDYITGRFG